jgi:hypothetical protein
MKCKGSDENYMLLHLLGSTHQLENFAGLVKYIEASPD